MPRVYDPEEKSRADDYTLSESDRAKFDAIEAAEAKREADQRRTDEEFAGIVNADQQRSALASKVLGAQERAAKGGVIAGSSPGYEPGSTRNGLYNQERDDASLYNPESEPETKSSTQAGQFQGQSQSKGFSLKGVISSFSGLSKVRRYIAIFSILATMVGGISAGLNFIIQPFQLPTISQFLEDRKYAPFNNASERAFQHAFTAYLTAVLFPGMREKGCPTTKVARNCSGDITGDGPVKLLWRKLSGRDSKNASIEYKLAQKGIEFQNSNGRIYLRIQGVEGDIDMGPVERGEVSNIFDMREVSRSEARRIALDALRSESDFKSYLYRKRVGALLKKYGIIRCYVACEFKERLRGTQLEMRRAGLAFLNQRVFETRAGLLGLYLNCMLAPCSDILSSPGPEGDESTMGEPNSDVHRSTRALLAQLSGRFGAERLADMVKRVEDLDRDGLSLHLTKLAIERIGGSLTGRQLSSEAITRIATPIGWVLMAIRIAVLVSQLAQLKTMVYLLNASTAVQVFEMMRTVSQEAKAGQTDAVMLGSVTNIFRHGPFNAGPGLEDSPAWDNTVATVRDRPAMAFMRALLPQTAYAQASNAANLSYTCADGETSIFQQQGEAGEASNYACDEMRLGFDDRSAVKVGEIAGDLPVVSTILDLLELIQPILSYIGEALNAALAAIIPGYQALIDTVSEWATPLITGFFQDILKDVFGDRPSGARMGELAILGAEVGGKDSAHRLLGGQVLTPGQQAEILQDEIREEEERFASLSLKDRLFSTDTPYSLTGQLALTAPSDMPSAMRKSFASLLGNPFGKLANSVASVFTLNQASAQEMVYQQSMFNVVAHGYPRNHEVWNTRPDVYWDENCADGKINEAYNTAKEDIEDPEFVKYGYVLDQRTNQPVNPVANPCFMWYTLGHFDEDPKGASSGSGPITRQGTQLLLNGKPWKFAGVNADTWFGCWPNERETALNYNSESLDQYFRELNPNSLTRIWPYGHMADVEVMNKIIEKAHQYNQYLIVTLFDGNEGQCGTQPIGDVQANYASIKPFIEMYAKGKHPHADAIAFWEMSNESCNGAWFNALAPLIKQSDPGTLISTGSHAAWCYGGTGEYIEAHRSEAIDLISMHEYDAATGVSHWGGPAAEAARALNKPWFSGEDGFCCGGGDEGQAGNAEKVKAEWQAYIDEPECGGMLYWDFKFTHPASSTMTFGSPMWQAASEFRHQYNGGGAAAAP